ncbi:MAG: hypothetical protein BWY76_03085 [bacterium ADurb.Bin429]|nr:MAG: hypothetical protein BWY76_03085 [bacterium ADurb.Bin429]
MHLRAGFLDLIQQHDGIRMRADGAGELAFLIIADVAWGRADKPRGGVPLGELRHIQPDNAIFRTKEELGERLCQLGFSGAGRTKKQEDAQWTIGILQPSAGGANRFRHRRHRLILPFHALMQHRFHLQQALLATAFMICFANNLFYWDTGLICDDTRDLQPANHGGCPRGAERIKDGA